MCSATGVLNVVDDQPVPMREWVPLFAGAIGGRAVRMVVGRTPLGENRAGFKKVTGRDHHPNAFSLWLAGGGVKGGYVHGATDEFGFAAVDKSLAEYANADGSFDSYTALQAADKTRMQAELADLSEKLARIPGVLGLKG